MTASLMLVGVSRARALLESVESVKFIKIKVGLDGL